MALTNVAKPSTSLTNDTKISSGETWASITTTWAGETRTWLDVASNTLNIVKPSNIVDGYDSTNFVTNIGIQSAGNNIVGQTFSCGSTTVLTSCAFYLARLGSPTGSMTAKLYAITGTFGTTSKPTGSALATSVSVDPATVSTTQGFVTFTFSTPYTLQSGTNYAILLNGTSITGDASNLINWGQDTTAPTGNGNKFASTDGGTNYTTSSSVDMCYYVYGAASAMTNQTRVS